MGFVFGSGRVVWRRVFMWMGITSVQASIFYGLIGGKGGRVPVIYGGVGQLPVNIREAKF